MQRALVPEQAQAVRTEDATAQVLGFVRVARVEHAAALEVDAGEDRGGGSQWIHGHSAGLGRSRCGAQSRRRRVHVN